MLSSLALLVVMPVVAPGLLAPEEGPVVSSPGLVQQDLGSGAEAADLHETDGVVTPQTDELMFRRQPAKPHPGQRARLLPGGPAASLRVAATAVLLTATCTVGPAGCRTSGPGSGLSGGAQFPPAANSNANGNANANLNANENDNETPPVVAAECARDGDCDDGDLCNGVERCVAGECIAGEPLLCADDNPCTIDECDPEQGCVFEPNDAGLCDDGVFCNGAEYCSGGACVSPGDPCGTGELCLEDTDTCLAGYYVQGVIRDHAGVVYPDVPIAFVGHGDWEGADLEAVSDAQGAFLVQVPIGWSGRLVADVNHRFAPVERKIAEADTDLAEQNFTAFRNWYVDDDGDLQAGYDLTAPVGDFDHPFASVQTAADVTEPGDTVLIRAGVYLAAGTSFWEPVLEVTNSGTASAPIRFQNYADEQVVLDGEAVLSSSDNGRRRCIYLDEDVAHIELAGLVVRRAFREGILVSGSNILIEDCLVEDCGRNPNAAESGGLKYDYASNLLVRRCAARHCYSGFAARRATDVRFEDCLSYRNGVTSDFEPIFPENADGFQTSVARHGSDRVDFFRCVAWGNTDDGWDMSHSRDCSVTSCIAFLHNDLGLEDGDGSGYKIGNDQNEDDPLRQMRRMLARYCIAADNLTNGIDPRDGIDGVFYNNTAYGNQGQYGMSVGAAGHAATLYNNLSWGNAENDLYRGNEAKTADYNNWADASGRQVPENDEHSIRQDPSFTNSRAAIDTSWQGGYGLDDVRGIMPTLEYIQRQFQDNLAPGLADRDTTSVDRGTFVLRTTTAGQEGLLVPVDDDPRRFLRAGDEIQIEGVGRVIAVALTESGIELAEPVSFDAGAGVHLPWNGIAPDIGAVESNDEFAWERGGQGSWASRD